MVNLVTRLENRGSRVQILPGALIKMEQKYPEPTVGALILNDRREILLAKSWKWHGKYTLPGGHIEVGETAEEALKREVKEEVGLEIESMDFLILQEAINSKEFFKPKHFIFLDFVCRVKSSTVKIDNSEMQEAKWVRPEEALKLDIDSFTRNSIKKYLENRKRYDGIIATNRNKKLQ